MSAKPAMGVGWMLLTWHASTVLLAVQNLQTNLN
jgi:hypothetical protein